MTKRCFIALNLPQQAKWELESLIADLEKINRDKNIKFVNPRQLHITLHFLGDLDEEQIDRVKEILSANVGNFQPIEIITGQISGFPDLKQPNTIYLDCREVSANQLGKMHAAVGQALKAIGLAVDERKRQNHITLARIKGSCRFTAAEVELSELSIGFDQVDLMESVIVDPVTRKYKIIESYKLERSQA